MQSHIILHVFSSNVSLHPCFFLPLPSLPASRKPLCAFLLLTLLSLLPFDSAFCSTKQHLAYGFAPCFCLHSSHDLFFIVPFHSQLLCRAPLLSFCNDVFDRILSAVNGTDAPTLLSVLFDIKPTAHSMCCH